MKAIRCRICFGDRQNIIASQRIGAGAQTKHFLRVARIFAKMKTFKYSKNHILYTLIWQTCSPCLLRRVHFENASPSLHTLHPVLQINHKKRKIIADHNPCNYCYSHYSYNCCCSRKQRNGGVLSCFYSFATLPKPLKIKNRKKTQL